MKPEQIKADAIVRGDIFPEPVKVITTVPMDDAIKLIGKGINTNQVYEPILSPEQIAELDVAPETEPFDGNAHKFRLGVEAMRLAIAYEHDPYFSLSIARVDPLPHQLEAVYDYFLRLPRIRFLLADDPGAGKTIMAGLLIKELKARGLVKRILIVAPANLTFQWQREMKDKFREQFSVIRSDILRANYGTNPWQDYDQAVTSVSWVSRVEDARESLLRSQWDLVVVDEAHKMSAYSEKRETLAYKLGKSLSDMTDHYLLMTATPHKGDPENFTLFLQLLDRDVYGDISSLEKAMLEQEAPFYLRRVKEALVTFPDPNNGEVKSLFTKRIVKTIKFSINNDELAFYDALTRFVENQSIRAARQNTAAARAVGFTMAMLQRRFASSLYAVKRTLERMRNRREKILEDPEAHWRDMINRRLPEGFDELEEQEQQDIIEELEEVILSPDPDVLREEIRELSGLVDQAHSLEAKNVETKLNQLKDCLTDQGVFGDPKMKLLIFTEHKDTLDYLSGDGKEGRPFGKLRDWGLELTTIHGGMKIGDRDTVGSRIFAEREFKEEAQVMVATEAAGEGINLQFCWLMINFDIPWNPVRLEQRMGRIHRYGQEKDCLIFNFVAINTVEGRVLEKLFDRVEHIEEALDPGRTGKIFNVLGDLFPSNELERMLRNMYARNQTEQVVIDRIVKEVDTKRFAEITNSTLEGLAKKHLNLSAVIGKAEEARERRLVPEVIEDFFKDACKDTGLRLTQSRGRNHVYRVGRLPRNLIAIGAELEPQFGRLGKDYQDIVFDKEMLNKDPAWEWVTPGHPLFEALLANAQREAADDLTSGAIFYDLNSDKARRLDVYLTTLSDGCNNTLNQKLLVAATELDGSISIHNPTIFMEITPAEPGIAPPDDPGLPNKQQLESYLLTQALRPFQAEVQEQREGETAKIERHVETSLNHLLIRENMKLAEMVMQREQGMAEAGLEGRIKQAEDRVDELSLRLQTRRRELAQQKQCKISAIHHIGRAWTLPHPERNEARLAPMRRDEEVERIAVEVATKALEDEGYIVESVESQNLGYDLKARKPRPKDSTTFVDIRFVEVKGRAFTGDIALTQNEYKTAERLRQDYWLYIVHQCATDHPELVIHKDPATLTWEPIVKVEHYRMKRQS